MDQPSSTTNPVTTASVLAEIAALEEAMKEDKKNIVDLRSRTMNIWTQGLAEVDQGRVNEIKKQLGMSS